MRFYPEETYTEEQYKLLFADFVNANIQLRNIASYMSIDIIEARDRIFSGDIKLDESVKNSIKQNQKRIHTILSYNYRFLINISKFASESLDDYGEVYVQSYDVLWYYTDTEVTIQYHLMINVKRRLKRYKNETKPLIKITSSLILKLKLQYDREYFKIEQEQHRMPRYEDVVLRLGWRKSWIRKMFSIITYRDVISITPQIAERHHPEASNIHEKKLDHSMLSILTPVEKDAIMCRVHGGSTSDLCHKYKITARAINYAALRALTKLKSVANKEAA